MKINFFRIVLIILLTVFMVSILCACSQITEGEVYEKEFKPSTTVVRIIPIVRSNGKTTTVTSIPYIYTYPDRYIVKIREPKGDGTYLYATYYTIEDVFNVVNIGDTFSYEKGRDFKNEPYSRQKNEVTK